MIDIASMIKDLEEQRKQMNPTVSAHYGVKDEEFLDEVKTVLCDMIKTQELTTVLDKHFKELDNVGRVRVLAFADALQKLDKMGMNK